MVASAPVEFVRVQADNGTPLRFVSVKADLAARGLTIRRTGYGGEFRVAYTAPQALRRNVSCEATAYYSDDLADAYATALKMAQE